MKGQNSTDLFPSGRAPGNWVEEVIQNLVNIVQNLVSLAARAASR